MVENPRGVDAHWWQQKGQRHIYRQNMKKVFLAAS